MAVATETKIMEALLAHVTALSLTPAHPVAWPRVEFTPPASGKWIRVNPFMLPTVLTTLADAIEYGGLMQVDVMWPMAGEGGAKGPIEIAGAIASHFKRGTILNRDGARVIITKADVASPISDPPRFQVPVTVRYRCFASVA